MSVSGLGAEMGHDSVKLVRLWSEAKDLRRFPSSDLFHWAISNEATIYCCIKKITNGGNYVIAR